MSIHPLKFHFSVYTRLLMNPDDSDRIRLDIFRHFKPEHPHIYDILVSYGQFVFREHLSAPTYAAIAARFQDVIDGIVEFRASDQNVSCPECGTPPTYVRGVVEYTVHTDWWEVEILRFTDDGILGWHKMIQALEEAIYQLRELTEPPAPCKTCGRKPVTKTSRPSGTISRHAPPDLSELDRDSD